MGFKVMSLFWELVERWGFKLVVIYHARENAHQQDSFRHSLANFRIRFSRFSLTRKLVFLICCRTGFISGIIPANFASKRTPHVPT